MIEETNYGERPEDTDYHSVQVKELGAINFKPLNDLGGLALGRIK